MDKAADWIGTKHFRRFATGPRFVYPLRPGHILSSLSIDEQAPFILSKIANGGDVRRFAEYLFETMGPNIDHLLDWASEMKLRGSRDYEKLPKMSVDAVVTKADTWTKSISKGNLDNSGGKSLALVIDNDLSWYELTNGTSLSYEGRMMSHCVGSSVYTASLESGKTRIFSLRKHEHKPILTLELNAEAEFPRLAQVQKHGNGGLPVSLCDATVSLLNHVNALDAGRAQAYGLVCDGMRWSTVFDTWQKVSLFGRTAFSDGKRALFMCVTDASKPLLLASYPFEFDSDDIDHWSSLTIKDACDIPPHYTDQKEAAEIVSSFWQKYGGIGSARIDWLRVDYRNGTAQPIVDTYERVAVGELTVYRQRGVSDSDEVHFLPHENDPGRLIFKCTSTRGTKYGQVVPGQRIPRSQIDRCLQFLDGLDVTILGAPDNWRDDQDTLHFRRTYHPVRSHVAQQWRAYALDRRITQAGDGSTWEESDYLLRYVQKYGASVDIHLDGKKIVLCRGSQTTREQTLNILAGLRRRKLTTETAIRLESWTAEKPDVLVLMVDGKWDWIDSARKYTAVATKVLADRPNERTLNTLLMYGMNMRDRIIKDKGNSTSIKQLIDVIIQRWFVSVKDFTLYPVARRSGFFTVSDKWHYPLVDRMCDLADVGFKPEGKAQLASAKKCLNHIASSYGRGKVKFPNDTEYAELALRWYPFMPRKLLEKADAYWLKIPGWEKDRNLPAEYLRLLNDPLLNRTNLRHGVRRTVDRLLEDTDYTSVPSRDISLYARLFFQAARERYLFDKSLQQLGTLLGVFDAETAEDVELKASLKDIMAKYEAEKARYSAKANINECGDRN